MTSLDSQELIEDLARTLPEKSRDLFLGMIQDLLRQKAERLLRTQEPPSEGPTNDSPKAA